MIPKPMNSTLKKDTRLGRRLLMLLIISLVMIVAVIWMTIDLFSADAGFSDGAIDAFVQAFEGVDTLLPRLL